MSPYHIIGTTKVLKETINHVALHTKKHINERMYLFNLMASGMRNDSSRLGIIIYVIESFYKNKM